ncbi:MAG: flavodoxin family protein [Deltaproteobacteria bacterium]|nr:flavodoxin family protein [Deltaproteobacteria bacterium]
MKIVGIVGSPRRGGNTETLAGAVLAGAAAAGADTETIRLTDLAIKGCQACMYCRSHEECATRDGMQDVYRAIEAADKVVIGSPVYMFQMSSQTKAFMDRLYRYLNNDFTSRVRKETVLVFAQGDPGLEAFRPYFDHVSNAYSLLGFPVVATVVGGGTNEAGGIAKDSETMGRARAAGAALAGTH